MPTIEEHCKISLERTKGKNAIDVANKVLGIKEEIK